MVRNLARKIGGPLVLKSAFRNNHNVILRNETEEQLSRTFTYILLEYEDIFILETNVANSI